MINLIPAVIVIAFVVWEVYAHFVTHNKVAHTLSYDIRNWEHITKWRIGLIVRIIVLIASVFELLHLEQWHL